VVAERGTHLARTAAPRLGWSAGLLTALIAGCAQPPASPTPSVTKASPAFVAAQQQWRQQREAELRAPDGWTSLVGLHWLDQKAHYVGSGAGSGIRLAVGPERLGLVRRDGDAWYFTPERGTAVDVAGVPLRGRIAFLDDQQSSPTLLHFDQGRGQLSLIRRGERFALRVKHADAPTRRDFAGLAYWPGGPTWRVPAHFIAHPPGRTLPVVDMVGQVTPLPNAGKVVFERAGTSFELEAIAAPGAPLFLIFADRSSGHGSYPAGRYLDVQVPAADGSVVLDFNRAYNPPCAFTAFATCPLPPPQNRLDLAVEAGERAYHQPPSAER